MEGGEATISLPAEVIQRLNLVDGDELYWVPTGPDTFRVVHRDSEEGRLLSAAGGVLDRYGDAFRKLADS